MKAIRFHEYGGPDVLKLEEVATPDVPAGHVLIRVEAVGVNHGDVMRRRNSYPGATPLPFTPGSGVAGAIAAVGESVTEFQTGARVFALTAWGGYAEFVAAPAAQVFSLPAAIGAAEATALLVQGLTAWIAIRHAGRGSAGQSILIQAASSGVGTFAVQLAREGGAKRVFALASTPEKCNLAVSLGADAAFDYNDAKWPEKVIEGNDGRGVDIVLDMVGSPLFEQSLNSSRPLRTLCCPRFSQRETADLLPGSTDNSEPGSDRLLPACRNPRVARKSFKRGFTTFLNLPCKAGSNQS